MDPLCLCDFDPWLIGPLLMPHRLMVPGQTEVSRLPLVQVCFKQLRSVFPIYNAGSAETSLTSLTGHISEIRLSAWWECETYLGSLFLCWFQQHLLSHPLWRLPRASIVAQAHIHWLSWTAPRVTLMYELGALDLHQNDHLEQQTHLADANRLTLCFADLLIWSRERSKLASPWVLLLLDWKRHINVQLQLCFLALNASIPMFDWTSYHYLSWSWGLQAIMIWLLFTLNSLNVFIAGALDFRRWFSSGFVILFSLQTS